MGELTKDEIMSLQDAVRWSRKRMETMRETRLEGLKQYIGTHYSEDGAPEEMPVNLLAVAISILLTELSGSNPQALVVPKARGMKAQAAVFELAVNQAIDEMQLVNVIQTCVLNAFFSLGIAKVGLVSMGEAEVGGENYDMTELAIEAVDPDDFVIDMRASRVGKAQFIGDRYCMYLEDLKDSGLLKGEMRRRFDDHAVHSVTNEDGDFRAKTIQEGTDEQAPEFEKTIELWDLWLPHKRLLATFLADDVWSADHVLREVKWDGPPLGPYHLLGFDEVPNKVLPLPPIALWGDLNTCINALYRKLQNQAARQKTIVQAQAASTEDAGRVIESNDGDVIGVVNPAGSRETRFGGPDQINLVFAQHLRDTFFGPVAGNIEILGGLGPQASTLGQEQLLNANASRRVAAMADKVVRFATGIIRSIGWYEWTEPIRKRELIRQIPGTQISVDHEWPPDMKHGSFFDHQFDIVPFSMRLLAPGQRITAIMQIIGQLAPFIPLMQQQGIQIDFSELVDLLAKYTSVPELKDIMRTGKPMALEPESQLRQSPVTHRVNERVNRAASTPQSKSEAMMRLLSGKGSSQDGTIASRQAG